MDPFRNRHDAGKRLAEKCMAYAGRTDVTVLALPRGGVVVGYEVAKKIGAPLDVFIVRKVGVPGYPELAIGAVASGGSVHLNERVLRRLDLNPEGIETEIQNERLEVIRREKLYRDSLPPLQLAGRCALIVDDGLATGASLFAAIQAVRALHPKEIVAAVPVAAASSIAYIEKEVVELICVLAPSAFYSVGQWYSHFEQTSDDEVRAILAKATKSG